MTVPVLVVSRPLGNAFLRAVLQATQQLAKFSIPYSEPLRPETPAGAGLLALVLAMLFFGSGYALLIRRRP